MTDSRFSLIQLPREFDSHRVTTRPRVAPGQSIVILDADAPGCVRHFWITLTQRDESMGKHMLLRIRADGAATPQVEMSLDHFFGVMLGHLPYRIESAPLKVLPKNGYNCYLPIPFARSCKMELTNQSDRTVTLWSMVNWHHYGNASRLTPYRLHATFAEETPAERLGSFLMADVGGRGFVAGFVKAIRHIDLRDAWYHTGGDLWLIDGETNPHAMRGIGVEDVFGYSFGMYESCSEWTGTPLLRHREGDDPTEVVGYRFLGPDPVAFDSSIIVRFGSRANDTQSVVYYYLDEDSSAPPIDSAATWQIVGPFECNSTEDFDQPEFPERAPDQWPERWEAAFGQYKPPAGPVAYGPITAETERSWLDFTRYLRPPARTNAGTQPVNTSAYARTVIDAPRRRRVRLLVGFDDWLKVWLNGQEVASLQHDAGLDVASIPVTLKAGENDVLVKLSNFDNQEWRLWALSLRVEGR
ncbi:MAG: DUF2961 domain-containing protein [Armatimonadota bacterium]